MKPSFLQLTTISQSQLSLSLDPGLCSPVPQSVSHCSVHPPDQVSLAHFCHLPPELQALELTPCSRGNSTVRFGHSTRSVLPCFLMGAAHPEPLQPSGCVLCYVPPFLTEQLRLMPDTRAVSSLADGGTCLLGPGENVLSQSNLHSWL